MKEIYLNDLLNFNENEFENIKIRLNKTDIRGVNPIDEFLRNSEITNNEWLFWQENTQNNLYKEGQIAICFVQFQNQDRWLLTTIKKVTKNINMEISGVHYEGIELEKYKQFFGRVVIKYHNISQQLCRKYESIHKELQVEQILPAVFDGDDFPGYDKVRISYKQLEDILKRGKKDWIAALENQKAVYLISDKSNGKLYVGSATNNSGMLLQRWNNYITNGHGGNKELIKIVKEKGIEYVKNNFQYSILENYNAKVNDNIILEREAWWKETLQTRKYGYNDN